MSYWIMRMSVIHVRSTRPWWTDWNLKEKIVTMYSYVVRPPVTQSFVIPMTTTIITMNVKSRVTPGSPWTEFTRWCANVEWLPHCHWLNQTNYGKMYLQCSQRHCKLFTWWQFKPNKRTVQILTDGCEWFISGIDVKMTFADLLEALFPIIRRK